MKKTLSIAMCLLLALSLTACSGSGQKKETTAAGTEAAVETTAAVQETKAAAEESKTEEVQETAADETPAAEAAETGAEAETTAEGSETAAAGEGAGKYSEYVTLGEYTGMEIDVITYDVTDDEISVAMNEKISEVGTEEEVTDGASMDDNLILSMKVVVDGQEQEDLAEENVLMLLGYGEFGEEIDDALEGAKAGDEISVTVTLDDSYGDEWDGKKADYTIQVHRVYRDVLPEIQEYLKKYTDFDSIEDWEGVLRAELEEENEENQLIEARANAVAEVISRSEFHGYPQDLYDDVSGTFKEVYDRYAKSYELEGWTDIISEEDMDSMVQEELHYIMVVQEIADRENISLSDAEYQKYLRDNAEDYGFETAEDLVAYYGDNRMRERALMDRVGEFLVSKGTLNKMTEAEYEAKYSEAGEEAEELPEIEVAEYDPFAYVTLGDYKGISVDIRRSEVGEEDLQEEIDSLLIDEAEQEDVTDGAKLDDYVTLAYTVTIDGEEMPELGMDETEYPLGSEDPSKKFDDALIGAKNGDKISVTITLDDSFGDEYAGQEAVYDVTIGRVYRDVLPELTDEFVKKHTQYNTVEEYKTETMKTLRQNEEDYNRQEAADLAMEKVVSNAVINGCPQDLHDSMRQSLEVMYNNYAAFFGANDWTELLSEEEMEESVTEEVNTEMVIQAIVKQENLDLTDEELKEYIRKTAEENEYDSEDEFLEDYGEREVRQMALRDKVTEFLMDNCVLNELSDEEYQKIYGSDYADDSEEEEEDDESWEDMEEESEDIGESYEDESEEDTGAVG